MALDPHREVARNPEAEPAPRLFQRPSDAPIPLERIGQAGALEALRRELAYQRGERASLRQSARFWAGRITGRSRRRLLLALSAATIELAVQSDRLTERVVAQEELTGDIAATLGEDLTRLRAEVLHIRRLGAPLDEGRDG
jgi:hypothetical protein